MMDIDYNEFVQDMAITPLTRHYCAIALGGEVGEVLNEVKKEMRDNSDRRVLIRDELGDVLFYLTALGHAYGYSIEDIIMANVAKLKERQALTGRP